MDEPKPNTPGDDANKRSETERTKRVEAAPRTDGRSRFPFVWLWPLASALLIAAAIFVPRPGALSEPVEAVKVFNPDLVILAPEGGSYRFFSLKDPAWPKLGLVYSVSRMITDNQQVTRTLGWGANGGASLGFFHRSATWRYQLKAMQFGKNQDNARPFMIPDDEMVKLRPLIVAEMERREAGRGTFLNKLLTEGVEATSYVCWQNLIVLLAWFSLPLAVLALLAAISSAMRPRCSPQNAANSPERNTPLTRGARSAKDAL